MQLTDFKTTRGITYAKRYTIQIPQWLFWTITEILETKGYSKTLAKSRLKERLGEGHLYIDEEYKKILLG